LFSSRRRHTRSKRDWSSDVCSSDLLAISCPSPGYMHCPSVRGGVILSLHFVFVQLNRGYKDYLSVVNDNSFNHHYDTLKQTRNTDHRSHWNHRFGTMQTSIKKRHPFQGHVAQDGRGRAYQEPKGERDCYC